MENPQLIDLVLTEDGQAKLKTPMERYTLRAASGAQRVHRWWLARFMLALEDTKDCNEDSG
jgi:hypothetical protein